MSKISLSPSPTGSAVYTIASPAGSTDRTLNLPDAAGTVFVGGQALSATTGSFSGDVTLGSSVLETPTGSAPSYTCRAWVNFNGTGTVAIRASGNVSSISDNGTGDYTVNFTTAMPDDDYCVCSVGSRSYDIGSSTLNGIAWTAPYNNSTTSVSITVTQTNSGFSATASLGDYPNLNVAIFR